MFINVYHCDPKHGPFALDAGLPMDNAAIKTSPHNNVHKVLFIVTVSSRYNTKMQSSIAIISIIITKRSNYSDGRKMAPSLLDLRS